MVYSHDKAAPNFLNPAVDAIPAVDPIAGMGW